MSILFVGDIHLGAGTKYTIQKNGLTFRDEDFLASLDYMLDSTKPEFVVYTGDIYDRPNPRNELRDAFCKRLNKSKSIVVIGNHDMSHRSHAFVEAANYENAAMIISKPKIVYCSSVELLLVPWSLEAVKIGWDKYFNSLDFTEGISTDNVIIAGHIPIENSKTNKTFIDDGASVQALKDFKKKHKAAYVFMGHVHKGQVINKKENIHYIGALDRVNFGEKDNKPRCFLYSSGRVKKIENKVARQMTELIDPTNKSISDIDIEGNIVKCIFKNHKEPLGMKNKLIELGAKFVFSEYRPASMLQKTNSDSDIKKYGKDIKTAVKSYIKDTYKEDEQSELIQAAVDILEGRFNVEGT